MNRDKQIEEMDCKKCLHFEACQIAFRNSKALSIYEDDYTEEEYFADTLDCDYYLDKTIYRKASEVVRDIFNDLNEMWHKGRGFIHYSDLVRLERLHEQKYTENSKEITEEGK